MLRFESFTLILCITLGGKLQIFAGTAQGFNSEEHWVTERTKTVVCMSECKRCVFMCVWGVWGVLGCVKVLYSNQESF